MSSDWIPVVNKRKEKTGRRLQRRDEEYKKQMRLDDVRKAKIHQRANVTAKIIVQEIVNYIPAVIQFRIEAREEAEYWRQTRERWRIEDEARQKKEEEKKRYQASEVTITDPTEIERIFDDRYVKPSIYEPIFFPIVYTLYRLEHYRKQFKGVVKTITESSTTFKGDFVGRHREVRYEQERIISITYNPSVPEKAPEVVWTLIIEDKELAQYFQALLREELPPFSERVYNYCYFIISLYTSCKTDPYFFYGTHVIHKLLWEQIYNDGNEISINGYYNFVMQRELLYAGILWSQRHRTKLLDEIMPVNDLRKIIEEMSIEIGPL